MCSPSSTCRSPGSVPAKLCEALHVRIERNGFVAGRRLGRRRGSRGRSRRRRRRGGTRRGDRTRRVLWRIPRCRRRRRRHAAASVVVRRRLCSRRSARMLVPLLVHRGTRTRRRLGDERAKRGASRVGLEEANRLRQCCNAPCRSAVPRAGGSRGAARTSAPPTPWMRSMLQRPAALSPTCCAAAAAAAPLWRSQSRPSSAPRPAPRPQPARPAPQHAPVRGSSAARTAAAAQSTRPSARRTPAARVLGRRPWWNKDLHLGRVGRGAGMSGIVGQGYGRA